MLSCTPGSNYLRKYRWQGEHLVGVIPIFATVIAFLAMNVPSLAEQESAQKESLLVSTTSEPRIKALLIDADPLVLDAAELFFAGNSSFTITGAATIADARNQLERQQLDVVIVESTFPQVKNILASLNGNTDRPAIIVTYPLTNAEQLETLPRDSYDLALLKPLERRSLQRAIEHVCVARQLRRAYDQLVQRVQELEHRSQTFQNSQELLVQLQEQIAARDRRFRIAIHDIQNPLANLDALLHEIVRHSDKLPPTARESLELCLQATASLQALTDDLLSVAQLDYVTKLSYQHIDVATLLRSVARSFSSYAERKNIWINVVTAPDLPQPWADELQLRKALENLVNNAIKYTPYGGSVTLEACYRDDYIILTVRDTGVGMTPDDIAKAFEEFTRLSATPTAGEPSTGLGLYIVRRIAELHGGKVSVESKGKGQGSAFTLELPLKTSQQPPVTGS